MLTLNLKSDPYWIDLPRGVQVQVLPARSSLVEDVREEVFSAREAPVQDALAAEEDAEAVAAALTVPTLDWAKAMARHAIVAWEGVGDEGGTLIEPTPEYIDALMEDDRIFRAWRDIYVLPALGVVEEGND